MTRRSLLLAMLQKRPRILLRTGWQTRNIGDVCFTPAMLGALRRFVPEADVTCWVKNANDDVRTMIRRDFPDFREVGGEIGDEPVKRAFEETDLFLYNSGMVINYGFVYQQATSWDAVISSLLPLFRAKELGKPYGIYAQTFDAFAEPSPMVVRRILSEASFVYTRDTISLEVLRGAGVKPPAMDFAPDIALQFRQRDDARAKAYLQSVGLESGKFLMSIAHYAVLTRPSVKDRGAEHCARMRAVIERWVRETGLPVLLAPEDDREMAVNREALLDPLPPAIRAKVKLREQFWLPDEALSVALQSRTMFNMEPHLNLMALANGLPCLHCYDYAFGKKAQMFSDFDLARWAFDLNKATPTEMGDALLAVHKDYDGAQRYREQGMQQVETKTAAAFGVLRKTLGLAPARR